MNEIEKGKKGKVKPYDFKEPEITQFHELDLYGTYSYAQYLLWKFEDRVELIRGKVFKMAAPNTDHQDVAGNLFYELRNFLKDKNCRAYIAPCDVCFPKTSTEDDAIFTVLQPDVFVLCDKNKREYRGFIGAPDLVVEVLSPGNSKKAIALKFGIYQEFGVKEYWFINPVKLTVLKYVLQSDGLYNSGTTYAEEEVVTSDVLPGFSISLKTVFDFWR